MKKIVSIFLSMILAVTLLPVSRASADDLTGIALEKEMRAMVAKGIIAGYPDGRYAPAEKVNRGQFANFLARALDLPEGKSVFKDVSPTSKLAGGINSAAAAGIVSGYSATTFGPEDFITREQMAMMINRAMDYLQMEKVKGSLFFTDEKTITSSVSRLAISYMVGSNIISGFPDGNGFAFKPAEHATRAQSAAFIYRMLEQKDGQQGGSTNTPSDQIDEYSIGTIDSNGNVNAGSQTYKTLSAAWGAITNTSTQVVLYKGDIIKMSNGLVVAKPGEGQATTIIYQSDLKTTYAPVASGTELEYVTSDDSKITVKIAGHTGYVKHSDAYLVPTKALKGRSYYSVNSNGDLVHNLFNHATERYSSYVAGKAPSTFQQNVKYISWDGSLFQTESGTPVGTFHQYFNMLPARTSTNYSAAELEAIIKTKLQERENLYNNNPTAYSKYKDATKKSKLIGLGVILKDIEKTERINALMVLGMAIHESDFGMSAHAQNNNNIFGIKVYDSSPQNGASYASIKDCVASLAKNYLNKNYIPTEGAYANGGMPGNKARGINVRYASDPYWGQKVAGHMYQLDKAMGGKDFLNNKTPYNIYETTVSDLNVRSQASASSSSNIQYKYGKAGYPVVVVGTTADGAWKQIHSDSNSYQYGYVSSQYIKPLTIAK
ncbi:S-layer homology domain-containing protein [Bacillus testis]|uniref:S-layer homology domain-containing protein n=1 Tax=Bacillus testis TaxID=1622072 RepID=UPI00067F401E|nr:S-layer homology domain-containing protein [Bacillus testis]